MPMLLQWIPVLRRKKRIGENVKHHHPPHYQRPRVIPVQYGIITLAFVFALSMNAIEKDQPTIGDFHWNDSFTTTRQRKRADLGTLLLNSSQETSLDDEDESIHNLNENEDKSTASLSSTSPVERIAWVVTITGCGPDAIVDGAAVLKHSIFLTSIHGDMGGAYDYKLYAIYHPDGEECALTLKDLGYELIRRDLPVAVKDIEGKFLRKKIESNGCCGAKELVKLEAYTLTDHPIVVQLDLDVILLKPMDPVFDVMLGRSSLSNVSNVPVMWRDQKIPERINAFFTRDYHLIAPEKQYKAVQGGFLVLRPDLEVYQEFVRIIKKGIPKPGGWGGLVGPFYGFMTFQGIIPYYYDVLHKNEAIELNRCIYNQMMDNPRDNSAADNPNKNCRTNQDECEDCRSRKLEEIVSAHFTFCPKPWTCFPNNEDTIELRLCRKLQHEWFRIRSDLEQSWGRDRIGSGTFQKEHFFGFCNDHGKSGYINIAQPYGLPIPSTSESTDEETDKHFNDDDNSGEVEVEDEENSNEES